MNRRPFLRGIAVSSALLLWPLFLNGFPLIYWDTAQYLQRWILGIPSLDRPIGYSAWLGLFRGLPFGLYVAPILQSVGLSLLLWAFVRWMSRAEGRSSLGVPLFGLATASLVLSPSAPYVATLMPDVATLAAPFAAVVVLASGSWAAAALFAFLLSLLGHANLPIVLLAGVPVLPLLLRARHRPPWTRGVTALAGATVGVFLALFANHLWNGIGLLASPTPVFLAARLDQAGVLATVFLRRCSEAAVRLGKAASDDCDFGQALLHGVRGTPEAFLWDDRSPLNRSWPSWAEDATQFTAATSLLAPAVKEGLLAPETRRAFLVSGVRNVTSLAAGVYAFDGFHPFERRDAVVRALEAAGRPYADAYLDSRQAGALWHLPAARAISASAVRVATVTAFVVIFFALGSSARRADLAILCAASVFLASFYLSDLVVSGFAASNPARYAERVAALPLVSAVFLPWGNWQRRARTTLLSTLLVAAAVGAAGWHLGLVVIASGVVALVLGAATTAVDREPPERPRGREDCRSERSLELAGRDRG